MPNKRVRRSRKKLINDVPALVKYWVFRIVLDMGGKHSLFENHGYRENRLAELLGIEHLQDDLGSLKKIEAAKALEENFNEFMNNNDLDKGLNRLNNNIQKVQKLIGLSEIECQILKFITLLHCEMALDEATELLGELTTAKVFGVISTLLDIKESDVRNSFSPAGVLNKAGLLEIDPAPRDTMYRKINVVSNSFVDGLMSLDCEPIDLIKGVVRESSAPELTLVDYEHLGNQLTFLKKYLERSLIKKRKGVNILLHGSPGTGKTQLGKVLAHELGVGLFEVSAEDDTGDPIGGKQRLTSYQVAQHFLKKRSCLLMFDEAEDVFDDGWSFFGNQSSVQLRKGWFNSMIEENPVPTIWLSNRAHSLDPAFSRRFDIVIEINVPPEKKRAAIISKTCENYFDKEDINRFAKHEGLSPAVVARVSSVMELLSEDFSKEDLKKGAEKMINSVLSIQHHKKIEKAKVFQGVDFYDTNFISANLNPVSVADGLKEAGFGRICFYGPPGTGKTAYAKWLAKNLDVPLITKKVSDLVSMYVGQTEQRIAKAFEEAETEGALLLLDEVDSFLMDRTHAKQQWQVTEVNEMLTQMENYQGYFIASTNLVNNLDQAAIRRFDMKVQFNYLNFQQNLELFKKVNELLGLKISEMACTEISNLTNVTPGDYALIMRRHAFDPIVSSEVLAQAIIAETRIKKDGQITRGIGFASAIH